MTIEIKNRSVSDYKNLVIKLKIFIRNFHIKKDLFIYIHLKLLIFKNIYS